MTTSRRLISLAIMLSALTLPGVGSAQTQTNMTEAACDDLTKAEAKLNAVYSQVFKRHSKDAQFLQKFAVAQKAWTAFRSAELKAMYPEGASAYGSSAPLCHCTELATLTRERTKQLQEWLSPREGDVCAGSRT